MWPEKNVCSAGTGWNVLSMSATSIRSKVQYYLIDFLSG